MDAHNEMQHDIFMSPSILHFHGFILARQSSVERHELIHTNVELFSYFKLIRFWEGGGRLAHRKRYSKATISSGVTLINHAHISMRMENSYNDNLSDIYSGFLSSISNSWLNFFLPKCDLACWFLLRLCQYYLCQRRFFSVSTSSRAWMFSGTLRGRNDSWCHIWWG